jgi:hypothetical protein
MLAENNAVRTSEHARQSGSTTGERSHNCASSQIPDLQRVVPRSGNRTSSVRTPSTSPDRKYDALEFATGDTVRAEAFFV